MITILCAPTTNPPEHMHTLIHLGASVPQTCEMPPQDVHKSTMRRKHAFPQNHYQSPPSASQTHNRDKDPGPKTMRKTHSKTHAVTGLDTHALGGALTDRGHVHTHSHIGWTHRHGTTAFSSPVGGCSYRGGSSGSSCSWPVPAQPRSPSPLPGPVNSLPSK